MIPASAVSLFLPAISLDSIKRDAEKAISTKGSSLPLRQCQTTYKCYHQKEAVPARVRSNGTSTSRPRHGPSDKSVFARTALTSRLNLHLSRRNHFWVRCISWVAVVTDLTREIWQAAETLAEKLKVEKSLILSLYILNIFSKIIETVYVTPTFYVTRVEVTINN